MPLDLATIRAAHDRIRPHIHRTPILSSARLDAAAGARLYFKCENFQKIGAFKARGATNAILALDDATAARGVVTHSSGNHGGAVARAARLRNIPAHIVMPANTVRAKVRAVEGYGGTVHFCEPSQAGREAGAAKILAETRGTLIHPFENENVIAGQGTVALELLEDQPDIDLIVCPVGGGGLLSGTAIAAKALRPNIRVIAAEPAGAGDAAASFRAGRIIPCAAVQTIADGLRTTIGAPNFAVLQRSVDDVVTVTEAGIVSAMRTIWETLKIVIEPSAAVGYAAVTEGKVIAPGQGIGIVVTGGNVDLDALPWGGPTPR